MSELDLVKTFHGITIPVEIIDEENIYFNVSSIAKKYKKNITEWQNSKRMEKTLQLLEKSNSQYPLILTKDRSGTQIHKKLFVNFARFISVEFEIKADEIITEILLDGKHLCEKERAGYVHQIKQLKERSYAKPRTGDFQLVDRIRQDYNIQASTHELNELLEKEKIIINEPYMVSNFEPNEDCDYSIKQGRSTLVYTPTLLDIVDDCNIKRGEGFEDLNQRLF